MYLNVIGRFSQALLKGDKSVRVMRSLLASQQTFVDRLVQLMKAVQRESGNRKKKSALMPAKLIFKAEEGNVYPVIFKHGDDLRQDQLILQIISLMDKLLRKENLDLKLTPYKVLATSTKHGFMQFVQSVPVAEVLVTEGNIQVGDQDISV
ncbi:unnamed protein product [Oncorhynchus mykiss]|uniref:PI3K/PI4K catalytic domain-containing protein n=1 Tax=Oncorhynchus mykiss TaxID=8022 RepID=A0A060WVC9_ONCMY|nr:unnamed protein product [Oncorhynchus mykiss]